MTQAIDKIYIKTLQDNIRRSLKHNKSKEQHMELAPIGYKSIRDENNKIEQNKWHKTVCLEIKPAIY